jgi:hypothetical protein
MAPSARQRPGATVGRKESRPASDAEAAQGHRRAPCARESALGCLRIQGELENLGHDLPASTIREILPDDFDWQTPARRMVLRYIGKEGMSYAEATFGFPRVPFRVRPQQMSTWNGGGFDRTFHRDTVWHEAATR